MVNHAWYMDVVDKPLVGMGTVAAGYAVYQTDC